MKKRVQELRGLTIEDHGSSDKARSDGGNAEQYDLPEMRSLILPKHQSNPSTSLFLLLPCSRKKDGRTENTLNLPLKYKLANTNPANATAVCPLGHDFNASLICLSLGPVQMDLSK